MNLNGDQWHMYKIIINLNSDQWHMYKIKMNLDGDQWHMYENQNEPQQLSMAYVQYGYRYSRTFTFFTCYCATLHCKP